MQPNSKKDINRLKQSSDDFHSLSTRDNFTSPKTDKKLKKRGPMNQCYVEEKIKALETFILQAYSILRSLVHRVKQFTDYQQALDSNNTFKTFRMKKRLPKNFRTETEIEALKDSDKHKFKGRNVLGVRMLDDWIDNLEIGNVM